MAAVDRRHAFFYDEDEVRRTDTHRQAASLSFSDTQDGDVSPACETGLPSMTDGPTLPCWTCRA